MSKNNTKFLYVVEGVKLPENIAKAIESEIEQVVMKHMATMDEGRDFLLVEDPTMWGKWPLICGGLLIKLERAAALQSAVDAAKTQFTTTLGSLSE